MPRSLPNLIVVCLDGLGAAWLGPYGNTWYDTPTFNRLAAESVLFEFAYAEGPDLDDNYAGYWRGRAAGDNAGQAGDDVEPLARWLEGRRSALVTDEPAVARRADADLFGELVHVEADDAPPSAESAAETQTASTLGAAAQWLSESEEPTTLWVHARAVQGPWDAPYSLRQLTVDEGAGDPQPPTAVTAPSTTLSDDYDPDELLGYMQAHCGQVATTDAALGGFLAFLAQLPQARDSIVVVVSPRGYPLGEHRVVGGSGLLFGETLQTPCLIRTSLMKLHGIRSPRVTQPRRLFETLDALADEMAGDVAEESSHTASAGDPRQAMATETARALAFVDDAPDSSRAAVARCGERLAIRTPGWFLTEGEDGQAMLYAKPDDRWEVNEVADLCPDAVDELKALLEQYRDSQTSGDPFTPELSTLLREGYE